MNDLRALPSLACAGFASMTSMRMCDAMLPALGQAFGRQPADAAQTVSAFALAYGLMQLVYGPLGDRFGKPRVIMLAACGCAVTSLVAALAPSLVLLSVGRALMGAFAAGVIPLTMAWIGDRVPHEQRQEVLARLLTYTVLGMMLGSWAGGAIAQVVSWRTAFVAVGLLFLLSAGGVARAAREAPPATAAGATGRYLTQVKELLATPWARVVFTVVCIEGALVFGVLAFVPTALHDRFQLSLLEAGAVTTLFGFGGLLYSRIAGTLVRALGMPLLAGAGATALALAIGTLAVMPNAAFALPACLLAGLGFYMLHNTLQTCATQLSTSARGTGVSMFACALFLGQSSGIAAASIIVGRLSTAFWFVLAAPLLLALGAYFALQLRGHLSMRQVAA
ncbi:MAG: MFS transporter [Burkholderiaceae bacterium]|nr:MFS transporter [Burkholderiaceae bacterium]